MLRDPTPFGQVGSYALLDQGRQTHLVRIQYRKVGPPAAAGKPNERLALVSFPAWRDASASKTVALNELRDATPLSPVERAELNRLERELAAKAAPTRAKVYGRYRALRERDGASDLLRRLMEQAGLRRAFDQLATLEAA